MRVFDRYLSVCLALVCLALSACKGEGPWTAGPENERPPDKCSTCHGSSLQGLDIEDDSVNDIPKQVILEDYVDTHFDDQFLDFVDAGGDLVYKATPTFENYVINAVPWSDFGYVTPETPGQDRCSGSCHDGHNTDMEVALEWFVSRHRKGLEFYVELPVNVCTQCHNGAGWAKWVDPSNLAFPDYIPPDAAEFGSAATAGHPISCNVCHDQTGYPSHEDPRLRWSGRSGPLPMRSGGFVQAQTMGPPIFNDVTDATIDLGDSDTTCASCHQGRVSGGAIEKLFKWTCDKCEADGGGGPPGTCPPLDNRTSPASYTEDFPCPTPTSPRMGGTPPNKLTSIYFQTWDSHGGHVGASMYSYKGAEFPQKTYSVGNVFHQGVGCIGCHMKSDDHSSHDIDGTRLAHLEKIVCTEQATEEEWLETCGVDPDGDVQEQLHIVGGHTFEPNPEQCVPCHGTDFDSDFTKSGRFNDYDGDGDAQRPYDEVNNLIARLIAEMKDESNPAIHAAIDYAPEKGFPFVFANSFGGGPPIWYGHIACFQAPGAPAVAPCTPDGRCNIGQGDTCADDGMCYPCIPNTKNDYWTPTTARAIFNLHFVRDEVGMYVHNLRYAVQLLRDSIEAITGESLGGVRPSGPDERPTIDYSQLF